MTYFVIIAFALILLSLGGAMLFMLKGKKDNTVEDSEDNAKRSSKMAWALAARVGLSVLLFICILISWLMGWIEPTGIKPGQ
jgi:TRAP-type C4-dicarboxylate transport system permease large subunit